MEEKREQVACEKARERIIENAQKGEAFRIAFKGNPQVYEGIPVALPGLTVREEDCFEFKVREPPHKRGMKRFAYCQIANMEKLR